MTQVDEKYAVTPTLGVADAEEASCTGNHGHNSDVMTIQRKSGKDETIYFNSDKHWAALRKALGPREEKMTVVGYH